MKCEIIQDLIPLMEDNVCSDASREAVLAHIRTCEACRKIYNSVGTLPAFSIPEQTENADAALKSSFRKVKRRWLASVLVVLLAVLTLWQGYAVYRNDGVNSANFIYYLQANRFVQDIINGEFESAYRRMNNKQIKQTWLASEQFDEDTMANYDAESQEYFCNAGEVLMEECEITGYKLVGVDFDGLGYSFYFNLTGAEMMIVHVSQEGITDFGGAGSFKTDPISKFAMWREALWQHYSGVRFNEETNEYEPVGDGN